MNYKKLHVNEVDTRGVNWEYTVILDNKLNLVRVFEGSKVNKDSELIYRYALTDYKVNKFNNKDNDYFINLINDPKCINTSLDDFILCL